jgi:hypothetical protein
MNNIGLIKKFGNLNMCYYLWILFVVQNTLFVLIKIKCNFLKNCGLTIKNYGNTLFKKIFFIFFLLILIASAFQRK